VTMTSFRDSRPDPAEVLRPAYEAFGALLQALDEEQSWAPTGCTGWSVRDLAFHCLGDAQRGLVALHTPADGEPDRDAVTYWSDWGGQSEEAAARGRLAIRAAGSMFPAFATLRDRCLATAAAVLHAAGRSDGQQRVATQGHVLRTDDLLRTLAVEATVHHLDLTVSLPGMPAPSPEGLAEVRRTLDGLLGRPVPVTWDDAHYARAGTGRAPLTGAERAALGADAARFPLFS